MKDDRLSKLTCYHVYQRTVGGGLLFYSVTDYLVAYTIVSTCARKRGICVLGFCQMPDHLHGLYAAHNLDELRAFVHDYTFKIAAEFNKAYGLSGPVFEHSFGHAVKSGDKKIRTALAYLYNNPVERRLCARAEEYRWNYLAYAISTTPFSESLALRTARAQMRRAVKEVELNCRTGCYLSHTLLRRLFSELDGREKNQLTDRIISLWRFVSFETAISFYGSYEHMVLAFASNTGSEYDIRETFEAQSDRVYRRMTTLMLERFPNMAAGAVIALPEKRKLSLCQWLLLRTSATPRQVGKYLHLRIE